jgi:hypothetical protein
MEQSIRHRTLRRMSGHEQAVGGEDKHRHFPLRHRWVRTTALINHGHESYGSAGDVLSRDETLHLVRGRNVIQDDLNVGGPTSLLQTPTLRAEFATSCIIGQHQLLQRWKTALSKGLCNHIEDLFLTCIARICEWSHGRSH